MMKRFGASSRVVAVAMILVFSANAAMAGAPQDKGRNGKSAKASHNQRPQPPRRGLGHSGAKSSIAKKPAASTGGRNDLARQQQSQRHTSSVVQNVRPHTSLPASSISRQQQPRNHANPAAPQALPKRDDRVKLRSNDTPVAANDSGTRTGGSLVGEGLIDIAKGIGKTLKGNTHEGFKLVDGGIRKTQTGSNGDPADNGPKLSDEGRDGKNQGGNGGGSEGEGAPEGGAGGEGN